MKAFWTIYILIFVNAVWLAVYLVIFRKKGMAERCTEHTLGVINRYSAVNYSGVHLPLVEYEVDGVTYKKAGPRFGGSVVTTIKTPLGNPIATYESNLTSRDDLPDVLKVKYHTNAMAKIAKSPLLDLYPIGLDDVNVYYNPSNPKEAYVERFCPPAKWLRIILITTACLTTVIAIVAETFLIMNG